MVYEDGHNTIRFRSNFDRSNSEGVLFHLWPNTATSFSAVAPDFTIPSDVAIVPQLHVQLVETCALHSYPVPRPSKVSPRSPPSDEEVRA